MNTENKGHLGQRRPCERNKANTKLNNKMNTTTIKLTRKTMTTKAKEGHVNVTQQRFRVTTLLSTPMKYDAKTKPQT